MRWAGRVPVVPATHAMGKLRARVRARAGQIEARGRSELLLRVGGVGPGLGCARGSLRA